MNFILIALVWTQPIVVERFGTMAGCEKARIFIQQNYDLSIERSPLTRRKVESICIKDDESEVAQ